MKTQYRTKLLEAEVIDVNELEDPTTIRPMEAYETLTIEDVNRQIRELEELLARLPS